MDSNKIIVQFVEGKMTPEEFYKYLYSCDSLVSILMGEVQLPQWAGNIAINLYYFLIEGDPNDDGYMRDAKELLGTYLKKNGFEFVQDTTSLKNYEIVSKAMPKWLDVSTDYFKEILADSLATPAHKVSAIKEKIKKDFEYLKRPPRWLQDPDWPIEDGIPLIFIGDLELDRVPGRARIYVFLSKQNNKYTIINQAD